MNEIAKHKASVEDADTQSKVRKRSFLPSAGPVLLPHVLSLLEPSAHFLTRSQLSAGSASLSAHALGGALVPP